jgi:hypothetical protein
MKASRLLLLAFTVTALAASGPAGAVTGYGVAGALHAVSVPTLTASKGEQKRTCQAAGGHEKTTGHNQSLVGSVKKPSVVACEQPPRSHVVAQGLKQVSAAAVAALG